jgi:hypothetical protein
MSSDATTLRLRDAPLADRQAADGREQRTSAQARARRETRIAAGALIALVGLSLLFVVIAADRPNLFTATARVGFFPGWMAGPLGGLWPGLTRSSIVLKSTFSGAMIGMYVAYLLALVYAPSRLNPRWTIAAIVSAQAIFFLAPPMALTDIFNYINYGRMEVIHHLNPYTTFPVLEPHSDPSYALSNWHELLSPYGPLFTLFTFALVPLGVAASFWTIKAILLAASLATLLLVWKCAQLLHLDSVKAIVFVGLNPIVLVWGLGGEHNDFLMVFFIVLGFYLLLRAREQAASESSAAQAANESSAAQAANASSAAAVASVGRAPARGLRARLWPLSAFDLGAGAAFVVATALKASAGVLAPIVLLALWRSPRRVLGVLLGMVAVGAVVGVASLIAFGLHIPDLSTQARLVTNFSVPNLIGTAIGSGGATETLHSVLSVVLLLWVLGCCVLAWRRRESITPSGWATVALLVTLGWVLPWYVLWLLPLAALSRSRRLRTTTLLLGVYLIIVWLPGSSSVWAALGFEPAKTPLGGLHQRYVRELMY